MDDLEPDTVVSAVRLRPGDDLKQGIVALARRENVEAGCVLACVGSLTRAVVRFAGQAEATTRNGPFEIVSLTGTVAQAGAVHLHICLTDSNGIAWGGHLMDGCAVYTTAEIVLARLPALQFRRETDAQTGYAELVIETAQTDYDG